MSLTEQQARSAYAPKSVAVTAGAGTGKTHMLAERYQYFLRPELGYTPLEIVAVTFTEKAATEMRARIRQTIAHHMSDQIDLLAELEAAPISTFHALAARVCREHPEEAEVPPDFTLLDDIEGKVWQAENILDALDFLPSELYRQVPYSLMSAAIDDFLRDPLSAKQALTRKREDWFPIVKEAQRSALNELLDDPKWHRSRETLESYSAPGDKLDVFRQNALKAIAEVEQGNTISEALQDIKELKVNVGSQINWGGRKNLEDVKTAIKALRSLAEDALKLGMVTLEPNEFDDLTEKMLPTLRQAFSFVSGHLQETKRLRRVLDFSDLEVHALKALEHSNVQNYYAQRWKVFLIDEFQDTNPVQGQFLEMLTQNSVLTIVGDVKQSIYGFRRADVKVFKNWCDRITSIGGHLDSLDLSFRTHDNLIQQINKVFKPILGAWHQNLEGYRKDEPHLGPHLKLFTVAIDDVVPKPNIEDCRRVEARHIADLIKTMIDCKIEVHDKRSNRLRQIEPGDIAILSRTWEPLDLYGQAIEGHSIPIIQAGGGNLLNTREAKDVSSLLRFLANPSDDLALVAVLRSPFFALSDPILFQVAQSLPAKTVWWRHIKSSTEVEIVRAVKCLSQLLIERQTEPPSRLVQIADRLTGYTAVIANLPGSTRREADWQAFLKFIKNLEEGTNDVLSVVRRLQRVLRSEVQVPRPAIEGGNAVSLMTVHAAKGLEWPIVFVPDLTRSSSNDSPAVRVDPQLGIALRLEDDEGEKQESALYTLLKYLKRQSEKEEAKRVLYVAMTRVRDQLILTAPESKGAGLDQLLQGQNSQIKLESIPFDIELAKPVSQKHPPVLCAPDFVLLKKMGAGLSDMPITALTDYAHCPKRFEYGLIEGNFGYRTGERSFSVEIGKLAHWAIEKNISDVKELARFNKELDMESIQEALELVLAFQESAIYETYRNRAEAWEHPVSLQLGTITLNGKVDLLGSDFVLDFKTDKEVKPEEHRFQLWAYAEAARQRTAHIAYLRHDKVYTFNSDALSAIGEEATSLIQLIEEGNFLPNASIESCRICPYAEICIHTFEDVSVSKGLEI